MRKASQLVEPKFKEIEQKLVNQNQTVILIKLSHNDVKCG